MHPEDEPHKEMRVLLKQWKEQVEQDRLSRERARGELEAYIKMIKSMNIPETYKQFIDIVITILERIVKNELDIQDIKIRHYETIDLLQTQIDILSDRLAGLDRHR